MAKSVALFLLNHPPLDEIGGTITDVIERYRNNGMTKKEALLEMNTNHAAFLKKYTDEMNTIQESCCEHN